MEVRSRASSGHIPELDGVRGIAIALVMALHFVCSQMTNLQSLAERLAAKMTSYGAWGVDLFFVLSGFLITGILADSRDSPHYYRAFYARRTVRIFPLYYAVLALLIWAVPASLASRHVPLLNQTRQLQAWLWTYTTNVYQAKFETFNIPYVSHFWSLAVEEHFYLVWPFIIRAASIATARRVCIGVSVFALVARYVFALTMPGTLYPEVFTPCRLDSLCTGAWFALAARSSASPVLLRQTRLTGWAAAVGILALSAWHLMAPTAALPVTLRVTLLAILFGSLIFEVSQPEGLSTLKQVMRFRWLRWLGKYSYGLYVYHGIVAYAFHAHGTLSSFERISGSQLAAVGLQAVVGIAVSIAIAVPSYNYFEARFLRLKSRFNP